MEGKITLRGNNLSAPSGTVVVGSVGNENDVAINYEPNANILVFEFDREGSFQNILLENSVINTSSARSSNSQSGYLPNGNINLFGKSISVTSNPIFSQINARNSSHLPGEDIILFATSNIEFTGFVTLASQTNATGNAGNIKIEANNFISGPTAIISGTVSSGDGGNITFSIKDTTSIDNTTLPFFISSLNASTDRNPFTGAFGNGSAGNIRINTGKLSLTDGVVLFSRNFGTGESGVIEISASESIHFQGFRTPEPPFPTGTISFWCR